MKADRFLSSAKDEADDARHDSALLLAIHAERLSTWAHVQVEAARL